MPLDGALERSAGGWSVRLPVHAENVSLERIVVAREEITVHPRLVRTTARIAARIPPSVKARERSTR